VEGECEGERECGWVRVGRVDGKWQARQTETCMQATMPRQAINGSKSWGRTYLWDLRKAFFVQVWKGRGLVLPTAVESDSARRGGL
jgi:hypothetical protein